MSINALRQGTPASSWRAGKLARRGIRLGSHRVFSLALAVWNETFEKELFNFTSLPFPGCGLGLCVSRGGDIYLNRERRVDEP